MELDLLDNNNYHFRDGRDTDTENGGISTAQTFGCNHNQNHHPLNLKSFMVTDAFDQLLVPAPWAATDCTDDCSCDCKCGNVHCPRNNIRDPFNVSAVVEWAYDAQGCPAPPDCGWGCPYWRDTNCNTGLGEDSGWWCRCSDECKGADALCPIACPDVPDCGWGFPVFDNEVCQYSCQCGDALCTSPTIGGADATCACATPHDVSAETEQGAGAAYLARHRC